MNIEIKNCNNIDSGKISLVEHKLNIKFAPNGTGKSTIARAIILGATEGSNIDELLPFKLREANLKNKKPEVNGLGNLQNVICFNEEYISQFVFKQDELLNNSFDIFIKTDTYRHNEEDVEKLFSEIKQLFTSNQELESLIVTLNKLNGAFTLSKSGISKSSTGMKGLAGGNKIEHIPAGLEFYKPFIQSQNSVNWVGWQTSGYDYAELSDNCPFCTSPAADKKEQIKRVGKEYDKNTIKNLIAIIEIINHLGDYFSDETRSTLSKITTLKDGLEKEHELFLITVKTRIDSLVKKLENLRTLSGFQFKKGDKVAEKLPSYKLDLEFFPELKSDKTQESIDPINASIDSVIEKSGQLQGTINKQRNEMQKVIEKHQKDINDFLSYAGYSYKVEIAGKDEQARLKLLHIDHSQRLSGGNQHLSFGERNAFAIVLFMYECLSKKPGLIILDDPISSFDKNKKYAIMEMLFRRDSDSCLKNKTVLMLTHDIEPIIDTVKVMSHKFYNQTFSSFLKLKAGKIEECVINKNDIQTFAEICKNALIAEKDDIIKLIYMRRGFEITDDKGDAYQVLSNLLHKRERAIDTSNPTDDSGNHPEMEEGKFIAGCNQIIEDMPSFSYSDILIRVMDIDALKTLYSGCTNGYEKLQVFRLIDQETNDSVIEKFIKETYHIENEFICQLEPAKFDTIPEYVVLECDKIIAGVTS